MKKILLITIGLSIALFSDFSRNNNTQIVTDSETNLQWQDHERIEKTWQNAIVYCADLTLGSYSDWRLPNIYELYSLVDDTKFDPSISPMFKYDASLYYWSSTTYVNSSDYALFIGFTYGSQSYYSKDTSSSVRCVRTGDL